MCGTRVIYNCFRKTDEALGDLILVPQLKKSDEGAVTDLHIVCAGLMENQQVQIPIPHKPQLI